MNLRQSVNDDSKLRIFQSKLLLVEGRDDQEVFKFLCRLGGIDNIQIIRYGGRDKLRNFISNLLRIDGFNDVTALGVVMDADTNANATKDRIVNALNNVDLPVPSRALELNVLGFPRVVFLVLPCGESSGELEDVCLASIEDEDALQCVEEFLTCVEDRGITIRKKSKARLQAYLSTKRDPDKRIGEAMNAGYFSKDSDAFKPLRSLLTILKDA